MYVQHATVVQEQHVARALDVMALEAYCRHLTLPADSRALLAAIRTAPPSRTPRTRHGNVAVWYPSKKLGRIIKAESAKVEFAFLLEAEHDEAVLEFYDQPPPILLEYRDRRGHLQRPLHTADYFVFRAHAAGWEECKPTQELVRQAQERPNRYRLGEDGVWRCPHGEAFAARYGLTYRVRAADQSNWAAQSNWLFLEDYYQDLEQLHEVLAQHYDTPVRAPKRGAYGEYLQRSAEQQLASVSQRTFYAETRRHQAAYD
jgi:putative transposase